MSVAWSAPFRHLPWLATAVWLISATAAPAATLNFSITASEPVTVTGSPRLAIDVGGVTRYANYAAGSGTAALTFAYQVQPGDFDANGITLASPVDLNGGSITDIAGNPALALSFTLPDTAALKVQTYTTSFTTSPITNANANDVSFAIAKAPSGASFDYTITSSGGAGSVTGTGIISGNPHTVSGVDVSALPAGTLTLSVTLSTTAGGTGEARTATAAPVLTAVLDGLPATLASYSVRRIRGAYTGPLLRVRRNSDDAEQDIGATMTGNLNLAALGSFCGFASCFVSIWYDQSGNSRNAMSTSVSLQPQLVNAGAVETEGGRPALSFTSAGGLLETAAAVPQSLANSFNAVARCTDTSIIRHILGDRNIGSPPGGRQLRALSGGSGYFGSNIGGAVVTLPGSTTQQRVITSLSGPSGMSGALDGVFSAGGASSYFFASVYPLRIGGGGFGQGGGDWRGTISEVTLFDSTLTTASRQALESNQGDYFGITVP